MAGCTQQQQLLLLLACCLAIQTHSAHAFSLQRSSSSSIWRRLQLPQMPARRHQLAPPQQQQPAASAAAPGADADDDEVLAFPGFDGPLPSRHFAGRITVDASSGRQLFYLLSSHRQPQQPHGVSSGSGHATPLIVWLTGGPGCSSLDAWAYEHGTFVLSPASAASSSSAAGGVTLSVNPHSWSTEGHVLYIDSPAGTGYSYTPGWRRQAGGQYHTNDEATLDDLEAFLARFFERHAWLRGAPLIVAGESYAGVYVPLLARRLLRRNNQAAQLSSSSSSGSHSGHHHKSNLAGYLVINAVTDDEYDGRGQVDYAWSHGLIDNATYTHVLHVCKKHGWHVDVDGTPCSDALDAMADAMGPINKYDITQPCFTPQAPAPSGSTGGPARWVHSSRAGPRQPRTAPAASAASSSAAGSTRGGGGRGSRRYGLMAWGPRRLGHTIKCADRRLALAYFNSPKVRAALHAPSEAESGRWEPCSDVLAFEHTAGSVIPAHQELLAGGVPGLVMSGDLDLMVPFTGSRDWVFSLGLPVTQPWRPWSVEGVSSVSAGAGQQQPQQVAGFLARFGSSSSDGGALTFATVKGAGHMVPQTQPEAALTLLRWWLADRRQEPESS